MDEPDPAAELERKRKEAERQRLREEAYKRQLKRDIESLEAETNSPLKYEFKKKD